MQSQSGFSTVKIKLGNGIIVGYYCALIVTKMLSEMILPVRECNKIFEVCKLCSVGLGRRVRNAFRIAPGFFVSHSDGLRSAQKEVLSPLEQA